MKIILLAYLTKNTIQLSLYIHINAVLKLQYQKLIPRAEVNGDLILKATAPSPAGNYCIASHVTRTPYCRNETQDGVYVCFMRFQIIALLRLQHIVLEMRCNRYSKRDAFCLAQILISDRASDSLPLVRHIHVEM